ncbi:hypothetical protein LSAT2_023187 [Lamellibrachia satsuma]|nr:hypothetical protein LSAT2_023187 [Lamellibrachia satsuma]
MFPPGEFPDVAQAAAIFTFVVFRDDEGESRTRQGTPLNFVAVCLARIKSDIPSWARTNEKRATKQGIMPTSSWLSRLCTEKSWSSSVMQFGVSRSTLLRRCKRVADVAAEESRI